MRFVFILMAICGLELKAQEFDHTWIVGDPMAPMTFSGDSVINGRFADTVLGSTCTIANICDRQGNLLFFTNGVKVYDGQGHLMQNGDSLSYSPPYYSQIIDEGMPGQQGVVILPVPNDTTLYDIFHYNSGDTFINPAGYCPLSFYYSQVDITANGGSGKVINKNIPLLQNVVLSESRLSACRHANGRDWWIIKNVWRDNIYYEYLLTPEGIQGPYIQQLGPTYGTGSELYGYSQFSPDGTVYASATTQSRIVIMDFDRCSGLFSNPRSVFNQVIASNTPRSGAIGLAFSPNNRFLYVCDRLCINQYDLANPRLNDSIRIVTLGVFTDTFQMHAMQLGPNGKIYVSCYNGGRNKLHVINYPDSLGSACDFHLYAQQITTISPLTVPYFPNYKLSALLGACDTIHTDIAAIAAAHPDFAAITPNPATDYTTLIWYSSHNALGKAKLYDMSGRLVWDRDTHSNQGTLPIDVSGLVTGTYVVRFEMNGTVLLDSQLVIAK
ncbi:MAG: T9SS type A sorting domain-containing protein [Bacteroidetes bacterium]|nr:T9SS type A sorting domain-containing protein [Bacteroidota bacterium]